MTDSMADVDATADPMGIREHMAVMSEDGERVGTVDHVEGATIKLTRAGSPDDQHHWIPVDWVDEVDEDGVRLSRPASNVRSGWMSNAPQS